MTVHILGVGAGLFIVICIWAAAILLCIISHRTQKNIGFFVIIAVILITVILICVPREEDSPTPPVFKLYDNFFVWRIALVIFLGLSSLTGFLLFLVLHLMEPRHAQPVKYWKL